MDYLPARLADLSFAGGYAETRALAKRVRWVVKNSIIYSVVSGNAVVAWNKLYYFLLLLTINYKLLTSYSAYAQKLSNSNSVPAG
ncbi:MAG: hypothetical protein A3F94_03170 [Candidatus Spechtbacteria bacterium RIFCSPLOWO2_12_FULL_38_22]|uniref:Uncharacterized protein n=1 Tax=Candidatus Spechtbacteria bacterium RIFCSPLOWO2_12_FULL_38_22 TaxID=1802165 RepID=A0A1G2HJR2_9BACT|nr:MAG: hypothetical protein A3F94_03170 [Candidatus Spechtbacteria bacterium RIFCSPLOWO2_12_FULL_38_22]